MRDPIPRAGENYVFTEGVHINFCYTKLAFSQIEIQTVSFSCSFRATIEHTSTSTSAATNVKRGHDDDDTTPSTNHVHVVYRERPQQQQQQQQPGSNNKKKVKRERRECKYLPLRSLFLSLFWVYDVFKGDVFKATFLKRPF